METKLTWKKKFFSNFYGIYSNNQQIGKLGSKTFSKIANGDLNGKEYSFRTKGLFQRRTEIIDNSESKVIGEIKYSDFLSKASMFIGDKTINWQFDNLWNTKWSIFNSEGIKIQYSGSSTSGQIDSSIDDALLLLSGLYVIDYYWRKKIVLIVAVFIPIWTSVLS